MITFLCMFLDRHYSLGAGWLFYILPVLWDAAIFMWIERNKKS